LQRTERLGVTDHDPDRERRQRADRNVSNLSWIAFILAFIVLLVGIIYNRSGAGAEAETGKVIDIVMRDN
jgi:hypothetical protein